ncbi:MAG: DUF3108 domain-containing protein [Candidatus Competibacteraceae bacterium]
MAAEPLNIQAEGQWREDVLAPSHYQYQWGDDHKSSDTRLEFDWQRGIVETHSDDKQATLTLSERVVDPLSLQLLAMWDLHRGHRPKQYTLVIDNELETYEITLEGEEMLQTALGDLPAHVSAAAKRGGAIG